MAEVWDRTVAVARARWQALAGIALLLVWLPGLVQRGVQLAVAGPAGGGAVAAGPMAAVALIGIVTTLLALLGALAIVAVASEPALAARAALRVAIRRLPLMLGLALLLGLALALLTVPIMLAVPDLAAMQAGATTVDLSPAASLFVRWYSVALTVLLVWAQARLALLSPVVVNERQGLGSIVRSVRLTAGLTWRLVGVLLLLAVVAGVSVLAARSVTGVVAALLVGGDRLATPFLAVAAASLVAVGWGTLAAIFVAQLYLLRAGGAPASLVAPGIAPAEPLRPAPAPAPARSGPWG